MIHTPAYLILNTADSGGSRPRANHCNPYFLRGVLVLIALYFLNPTPTQASELGRKIGPMLKMTLSTEERAEGAAKKTADRSPIALILKGDTAELAQKVDELGGSVGTIAGDILTAQIPRHALPALMADPALERAEAEPRMRPVNDAVRKQTNIDHIHRDEAALGAAYRGRGVIVGIVDSGIDIFHPDFRDPADSTRSRILAIWDQLDESGPPPAGYSYGTLHTRESIERALRGEETISATDELGHGTHVAATAAGNGPVYAGMAPEADLIIVKLLDDQEFGEEIPEDASFSTLMDDFRGSLIDAAAYVFAQAEQHQQPAVVNLSLGTIAGPHDGTGLVEQGLDALLETPGRAICAGMGNEGGARTHWGDFELEPDSLWTYYYMDTNVLQQKWLTDFFLFLEGEISEAEIESRAKALEAGPAIDIVLYGTIEGPGTEEAAIALGATVARGAFFSLEPRENLDNTPWYELSVLAEQAISVRDTLNYSDGREAGIVELAAQYTADDRLEFFVIIRDTGQTVDLANSRINGGELFRLMARGGGRIHVWTATGAGMNGANPLLNLESSDPRYRLGDDAFTTMIPATARRVIAVGSHDNRSSVLLQSNQGTLSAYSSQGPTLDGRIKPEITAPGNAVISALSRDARGLRALNAFMQAMLESELEFPLLTPDEKHVVNSGTSMSTPVVSGSVGLYLQRNPQASTEIIRHALLSHAVQDSSTTSHGTLPNNHWGHGKLNILAAMGGIVTQVALPDAAAITHLQLFPTYPNPFNQSTLIPFQLAAPELAQITIYNLAGQRVRQLLDDRLSAGKYTVSWNGLDDMGRPLASGVYLCRLQVGQQERTNKMLLVR